MYWTLGVAPAGPEPDPFNKIWAHPNLQPDLPDVSAAAVGQLRISDLLENWQNPLYSDSKSITSLSVIDE